MNEKTKRQLQPQYRVDFVTALPMARCIERLERDVVLRDSATRHPLAPMRQTTTIEANNVFHIERHFPGQLYPIRLVGRLDPDPDGGQGTWVQASIVDEPSNQVLIEGLILFLGFFLATVLLVLRLKARALMFTVPGLIVMLILFGMRWRALRIATEDLARWVRRRLYVTGDQVR